MRKKILILGILFCVFATIGICASANNKTREPGVQQGIQTRDMSIDEGLKILGYNPSDFQIKETINVTSSTDLEPYYSIYEKREYDTPIEVLGITESYESISEGFIDTYIYLYSPYKLSTSSNDNIQHFSTKMAMMLQVNDNKGSVNNSGDGFWINFYGNSGCDMELQDFENLSNSYIFTSMRPGSVSSGVTRINIRLYKSTELDISRLYYVEKIVYSYANYKTQDVKSGNVTPSISTKFKGEDVEVGYDPDFSDSTMFTVANKSVVCVEAINYIYNRKQLFIDKTNVFILLRNKETLAPIDNCKAMQIIYKIGKDKNYRTVTNTNIGTTNYYKWGNVTSKAGQFGNVTSDLLERFKDKIVPRLENGVYPYTEYPQYVWSWNWEVKECETVYIWYEVEAGTTVQGSCYKNGLHVEYDENGNALGVYDRNGKRVDNVSYDSNTGLILNEDGSVKLPENSKTDLVYEELSEAAKMQSTIEILIAAAAGAIIIACVALLISKCIGLVKGKEKNKKD